MYEGLGGSSASLGNTPLKNFFSKNGTVLPFTIEMKDDKSLRYNVYKG
jgi:hypothetical protein